MTSPRSYKPIIATICEGESPVGRALPIVPSAAEDLDLFPFQDPFGLRRAIVPVLLNDADGVMKGMGTAFHIDGWGTFLTADHVVESVRQRSTRTPPHKDEKRFTYGATDVYPVLLLGIGLVLGGPIEVPPEALALVASVRSPVRERADPLISLTGRTELEAASDVAVMQLAASIPDNMMGTLRVRFSGWRPKLADTVVALGFPNLECQPVDEQAIRYLLSDGMSAAYGQIIAAHPNGLRGNPTPVIEVEANWPSGMSGGPVINEHGEVIGIVSRSLSGRGSATCLELMPWLRRWIPTLDVSNPGWRVGWAVMKNGTSELVGFFKERDDALRHRDHLGTDYTVVFGSSRIGSTDFIPK